MSKTKLKIISILAILILLFATPFVNATDESATAQDNPGVEAISVDQDATQAENDEAQAETNINESETTEGESSAEESTDISGVSEELKSSDVYLAGDNVTIDYMIDGNLFVMADTVTINSQIGGDAFIFAKNVVITDQGYVFGNVFNVSENIEVNGTVYDIYSVSSNITVSGFVYRDVKILSKNTNIFGTVRRNALINTNSLQFSQDVEIQDDESTTVTSSGIIQGNLTYSTPNELSISEENVSGEITYNKASSAGSVQSYLINLGTFLVTVIVIWLLCLWLAPKFLEKTNLITSKKVLPIIGFGLLGLIAVPVVSIALLFINITASISMLLLALYFIGIALSVSILVIAINNIICEKLKVTKNIGKFGLLIITAIIFWAIGLIPYVGFVIDIIAIILGLGLIAYNLINRK